MTSSKQLSPWNCVKHRKGDKLESFYFHFDWLLKKHMYIKSLLTYRLWYTRRIKYSYFLLNKQIDTIFRIPFLLTVEGTDRKNLHVLVLNKLWMRRQTQFVCIVARTSHPSFRSIVGETDGIILPISSIIVQSAFITKWMIVINNWCLPSGASVCLIISTGSVRVRTHCFTRDLEAGP